MNGETRFVLRRANVPLFMLAAAGWGIMMTCMVIWGLSDGFTTWRLPVWKMELWAGLSVTLFMCCWFSIVLGVTWYALLPLHRVKITSDEIRICMGPLTFRRMNISDVKTVVCIGDTLPGEGAASLVWIPRDKHGREKRDMRRLVLTPICPEELYKRASKNRTRATDFQVRSYMKKAFFQNRFWIEWTQESEDALRRSLPGTTFIR